MKYPRQSKLIGIRNEKGLLQKDMAILLDITEFSYSNKEKGATEFKLSEVLKLANFFNKQVEDIFLN